MSRRARNCSRFRSRTTLWSIPYRNSSENKWNKPPAEPSYCRMSRANYLVPSHRRRSGGSRSRLCRIQNVPRGRVTRRLVIRFEKNNTRVEPIEIRQLPSIR
jgi:hypothetical protein